MFRLGQDTSAETEVVQALILVIEELNERVTLLEDDTSENKDATILNGPLDLIDTIRAGQTSSHMPSVATQITHKDK